MKSSHNHPRIIRVFDRIKYWGIYGFVIFHCLMYDYKSKGEESVVPESGKPPPVYLQVLFFLTTCGGIFHIISSALQSYVTLFRLRNNVNNSRQLLANGVLKGFSYIFAHEFFNIFFSQSRGLVYLYLYPEPRVATVHIDDELPMVDVVFLFCHSLTMIGAKLSINAGVLFVVLGNSDGMKHIRRNIFFLLGVGISIIMVTPYVRSSLFWYAFDEDCNYFVKMITSWSSNNTFPLFPYVGYGLIGVVIGYILYSIQIVGSKNKSFFMYLFVIGIALLCFGFINLRSKFGVLWIGLFKEQSERGMSFRSYLQNCQLGIMLLSFSVYFYFVKEKEEAKGKKKHAVTFLSMTIYMFEGLLKCLLFYCLRFFWRNWNQSIAGALLFGVLNTVAWDLIGKYWSRINFKGSPEYLVAVALYYVTGVKSYKLTMNVCK